MLKSNSLKANAIMNALLTVSSVVFPLITFPYISRILMPAGMGKVSLAASVIQYFNMFAQLGIPTYGIRACAKVRDDKYELTRITHELLVISLVMSVIAYIALAILLMRIPRFNSEKDLYIVMSFTIFLSAIGIEWLYKGLEQYKYITYRSVLFKVISVIAMLLLVNNAKDYVIYGSITVFASTGSLVFNLINARKYVFVKPIHKYNFKRHIKPVIVFFAMTCATTVYINLDSVMLGFMKTDADVGYYNVAVRVRTLLLHVVTSLGAVLLPRSTYFIENKLFDEFYRISKKSLAFVILISMPLFVYFIMYAKELVLILAGSNYISSVLPMRIIMPTLLFAGVSNITGIQMLIPLNREKIVLYSEIAGAIIDFVVNIILIPRLSSTGAAIGTLVAEIIVLLFQYYALKREIADMIKSISYLKIIIALVISSSVTAFIGRLIDGIILKFIITACVFFSIYGLALLMIKENTILEIVNPIYERIGKNIWRE